MHQAAVYCSNIPFPKLTQSISQAAPLRLSIPAQQRRIFYLPELKILLDVPFFWSGDNLIIWCKWLRLICPRCIGTWMDSWEKNWNHMQSSGMRQQQHWLVNVTFVDKQLKALQFELCFDNWWLISASLSLKGAAAVGQWAPSHLLAAAVGSYLLSSWVQSKSSNTLQSFCLARYFELKAFPFQRYVNYLVIIGCTS